MSDLDIDPELRHAAQRVIDLTRRVEVDPRHKIRLREELMRRHHELTAEHTQRAAGTLWPRFARLKRLTVVAPPALAVATAFSILLWGLQITGHQASPAAQAAGITKALVKSVPTVVGWTVSVRQVRRDAVAAYQMPFRLKPDQRLYIVDHRAYLYSDGQWFSLAAGQPTAHLAEWQWAFAVLPARLHSNQFTVLPDRTVLGRPAEGIQLDFAGPHATQIQMTAWVDRQSGLVMQLDQVISRGKTVIERDSATYHYQRTQ